MLDFFFADVTGIFVMRTTNCRISKFSELKGQQKGSVLPILGGESFDKPNFRKLMKSMEWHAEQRPDWKVLTFVYEASMVLNCPSKTSSISEETCSNIFKMW